MTENKGFISTKNIRIEEFDYALPDDRIPRHPLAERDSCKMLVLEPDGLIEHRKFSDLPQLLPDRSLLVCNDTRVINARIGFEKSTGSRIEVFLLEPLSPADYVLMFQAKGSCRWGCMVGNLKRWKSGILTKKLEISGKEVELRASRLEAREGNSHDILFEWDDPDVTFASVVEKAGYIPIPPYLKRASEESDAEDYQTVFARVKGSVAAPTAGLHFTPALFDELRGRGVEIAPLTLHVGAGTFQPVKSETIGEHPMHTEVFGVSKTTLDALIKSKREGRKVVAVGTTSVRTLESLPYLGVLIHEGAEVLNVEQWSPYNNKERLSGDSVRLLEYIKEYMEERGLETLTASTSIMIAPGFEWRIVDVMITNFHQPQSTLLLLVSSFLERRRAGDFGLTPSAQCGGGGETQSRGETWRKVYEEALANDYRFLSYGDACLFL